MIKARRHPIFGCRRAFYVCVIFIEEGHLQLKGLLEHIVSGVLVLTAHQQRNIQIAGGDEQNLDVSHGQCVQGPGSYQR